METQLYCQVFLVVMIVYTYLSAVQVCFAGRKESKPLGFGGFIGVTGFTIFITVVKYGAGMFSELIK